MFTGAVLLSGNNHQCSGTPLSSKKETQAVARRSASHAGHSVQLTLDRDGRLSLKSGDDEFLGDGRFDVKKVLFTRPDETVVQRPLGSGKVTVDVAHSRVTHAYAWGDAAC
ncbi:MAG: hypothetical protein JWQ02_1871, partial [Capsulimonas sp.]|nr:hypothetical protein [Capsulimonas sp.]